MKIRRVNYSPDEFLAGVQSLSVEEIGFYWVACSLIYSKGGPIDNDPRWLGRNAGCQPRRARRLIGQLLAKGKLSVDNAGRLTNGRAQREIKAATNRQRIASKAQAIGQQIRNERAGNSPDSAKNKHLGRRRAAPVGPANHESRVTSHSIHESDARARRDGEAPRARDDGLKPIADTLEKIRARHRKPKP
jgi:uncharacterized protein YdaU (DUF1376 family)